MDDKVYRSAVAERQNLSSLLGALEAQLAVTQAQIKATKAKIRAVDDLLSEFEKVLEQKNSQGARASSEFRKSEKANSLEGRRAKRAVIDAMMDVAEHLILDEGRPLSRTELLQKLKQRGFEVEGTDKSKVLGTNLWRSQKFHNLKGIGYWPISHPVPTDYALCATRPSQLLTKSS